VIVLKILSNIAFGNMNIVSLSLAIYGLINIKKLGDLKIFILLPVLSFIDSFSLILLGQILGNKNNFLFFSEYFQIFFLNLELSIIIIFYFNYIFEIKSKLYYIIPSIITIFFLILNYFSGQNIADDYLPVIVVIEALFVNICFGVLFSLKIKQDKLIISQWANEINKGFFLFVNTTAPYYLIINYWDNQQEILATYLNFIGSIGYIILFYHIYKAIKCYQLN
jgi:hypothetical protein